MESDEISQLRSEVELLKSLLASASQELKAYQMKYPLGLQKLSQQGQALSPGKVEKERPFSMQPLFESYDTSKFHNVVRYDDEDDPVGGVDVWL
jgi:hypothetical protein